MLQKMKSIPEGDGSLLDNCMIVYGSGISDGTATITRTCRSCSPAAAADGFGQAGTSSIPATRR